MYSNFVKSSLAFAVAALVIAGCTPKTGEKITPPQADAFGGTSCMGGFKKTFSAFAKGEASNENLEASWDCLGSLLNSFQQNVRGQNRDGYTPQEVATFLEHNILEANSTGSITPALQSEIMKVKQIFVGGTRELITRQEIRDLIQTMQSVKGLTLRANPFMKIYLMKAETGGALPKDAFDKADTELYAIAQSFAGLVRKDYQDYSLKDLGNLVQEVMKFVDSKSELSIPKYLTVAQNIKATLLGGEKPQLVLPGEWKPILETASKAYVQYLRYHYYIEGTTQAQRDTQVVEWSAAGKAVLSEVEKLLSLKSTHRITRGEIDSLVASITEIAPSVKMSSGLLDQALKIKKTLLGGDLLSITQSDIASAVKKIDPLTVLLRRLVPGEKIYLLSWDPSTMKRREALRVFEDARKAIDQSGRELGALMVGDYEAYDLVNLLKEYEKIYSPNGTMGESLRTYMPLFVEVKNAIYEDTDSVVRKHEWSAALGFTARVYTAYLFNRYLMPAGGWSATAFDTLDQLINQVADIVGDMLLVKKPVGFSNRELANVTRELQKVWTSFKTSEAFIAEIQKVKVILTGGPIDHLTRRDIELFKEQMTPIKSLLGAYLSYSDVLTSTWKPEELDPAEAISYFNSTTGGFENELKSFGEHMLGSYDLSNLNSLLAEFERLYPPTSSYQPLLQKFLPVAVDVKNILFNDSDDVVARTEWAPLLNLGGQAYTTYLYYGYFVKKAPARENTTYDAMKELVTRGREVFKNITVVKGTDGLSKPEVLKLVKDVHGLKLLPESIQLSTMNTLATAVMDKVLNPPARRLRGEKPNGLRLYGVDYAVSEFDVWLNNQRFGAELFDRSEAKLVSSEALRSAIQGKVSSPTVPNEMKGGFRELQHVYATAIPFTLDGQGRLVISGARPSNYNLATFEQHNLIRAATRLLAASYVGGMDRIRRYEGFTLPEITSAYNDFKNVAGDLGWLDPKNEGFIGSRFQEANIFMPHSDGQPLASNSEIHDLLFSIMSALKLNTLARPALERDCGKGPLVNVNCVYGSYRNSFDVMFKSLPDFLKYKSQASNEDFSAYFYNTLKGIGYDEGSTLPLSYVSLQPALIQYIELIMTRFDINRDGYIVTREAKRAFPLFKGMLKQVAAEQLRNGSLREEDLLALYCWVLERGKPPEGIELVGFLNYRDEPTSWNVKADRGMIAKILGYVAYTVRHPAPPKPKSGAWF